MNAPPFDLQAIVNKAHAKAIAYDAVHFPKPFTVTIPQEAPFSMSGRALPSRRPLAIFRITDDTQVEFRDGRLHGARDYFFVIDDLDYRAGRRDVIFACFRLHRLAAEYVEKNAQLKGRVR